MNDPHIDSMTYAVSTMGRHVIYSDDLKPLSMELDQIGEFRIADNELTVALTVHCPDEHAARELVEPFLRAWEIHADMTLGHGAIRFGFTGAAWRDLNPIEGSVSFGFSDHFTVSDSGELRVRLSSYPEPPLDQLAVVDDLIRDIHARWCQYQEDREPLRSMANYVLTRIVLEAASGPALNPNYQTAARTFGISKRVLDEISVAAALPGTGLAARKAYGRARGRFVAGDAGADEIEAIYRRVDAWLEARLYAKFKKGNGCPHSGATRRAAGAGRFFTVGSYPRRLRTPDRFYHPLSIVLVRSAKKCVKSREDAIQKVILHLGRRNTATRGVRLTMDDLLPLPPRPTDSNRPSQ